MKVKFIFTNGVVYNAKGVTDFPHSFMDKICYQSKVGKTDIAASYQVSKKDLVGYVAKCTKLNETRTVILKSKYTHLSDIMKKSSGIKKAISNIG